jgi:hypothetical protein
MMSIASVASSHALRAPRRPVQQHRQNLRDLQRDGARGHTGRSPRGKAQLERDAKTPL